MFNGSPSFPLLIFFFYDFFSFFFPFQLVAKPNPVQGQSVYSKVGAYGDILGGEMFTGETLAVWLWSPFGLCKAEGERVGCWECAAADNGAVIN